MTKIIFVEPNGNEIEVDGTDGWSLMQIATANDINGIVGECGGSCSCATCHCYIETQFEKLDPASDNEQSMLEFAAAEALPNSRLSCQVKLSSNLDGMRIVIPAEQ